MVLSEVIAVFLGQNPAECLPRAYVELVVAVRSKFHEDNNEALHRASLGFADDLTFAAGRDLAELGDVAKLPACTSTGLDLDSHVSATLVRGNDVVVWHIAGEGGSDEPLSREFGRNQVLSSLPD